METVLSGKMRQSREDCDSLIVLLKVRATTEAAVVRSPLCCMANEA